VDFDKLGNQDRQLVIAAFRPAKGDVHIVALAIARRFQALAEASDDEFRFPWRPAAEKPDYRTVLIGSLPPTNTIGIAVVAAMAARVARTLPMMTAAGRRTRSPASSGSRSG